MAPADVLVVTLGGTHGLRESDAELAASIERAGATVARVAAERPAEVRTFVRTDWVWARAARRAAEGAPPARATIYSTVTAALLWPRPGAIRHDAPAAANRPGRHGLWQRPLERRRYRQAPLLVPTSIQALGATPRPHAPAVVVPIPVEPSGPPEARDLAAVTYAANPDKKGLDRVLAAWTAARREGEELVVCGVERAEVEARMGAALAATPGVRYAGRLPREEYRRLVRRARAFVTAPRREEYGLAQLEALADGTAVVTLPAPGPYAAYAVARAVDPRLTGNELPEAVRAALDHPLPDLPDRAREAMRPFTRAAVDRVVADELLPALLG
jgi:glycosyltransferase involved in cell wall biosynthesis